MTDNCLNSFVEPNYVIYSVNNPLVQQAATNLRLSITVDADSNEVTSRCLQQRIKRIQLQNEASDATVSMRASSSGASAHDPIRRL